MVYLTQPDRSYTRGVIIEDEITSRQNRHGPRSTSLQPETCLGEVLRHFSPERLHQLNQYRLTEISALFSVVLDCRQIDLQAFDPELLLRATDYSLTQEIGAAAISAGAEAILIPSATKLGDNLVVFPDQLQPDSALRISGSRDPVLYVDR